MATIKTLTEHLAILQTNVNEEIEGDDSGNLAYTALGRRDYVLKTTTDYTATQDDDTIDVSSAAAQTIQLPTCSTTRVGKIYTIRKVLDNSVGVYLVPAGSDLIHGLSMMVLTRQYDFVTVQNTLTSWVIIAERGVFNGLVFVNTASTSVTNTVTETSIIPTGSGVTTMPLYFFSTVGTALRVCLLGQVTNTGTPTLTVKVKLGGVTITTGAITTASGLSNTGFTLDALAICRAPGSSGTFWVQGEIRIGANVYPIYAAGPHTLNTTTALALALTAQWGTASASNVFNVSSMTANVER